MPKSGEAFSSEEHILVGKLRMACAVFVALMFIGGLLLVNIDLERTPDLSSHYYPDLSPEERTRFSVYNWKETRGVDIELKTEQSGMVVLRAMNSEIVYQTFLERNIREQVSLELPSDLDRIFVEYKNKTEFYEIAQNDIASALIPVSPFFNMIPLH
jgi:hypothetical protein